jgi:hypothetical protein
MLTIMAMLTYSTIQKIMHDYVDVFYQSKLQSYVYYKSYVYY